MKTLVGKSSGPECGKGRREDPPACLKEAIRKAYSSEDGWYKKFVPGRGGGRKRKHA